MCSTSSGPEQNLECARNILGYDLKDMDKEFSVVFLGTGASLPSKYRNVSCTLVNIRCVNLTPFVMLGYTHTLTSVLPTPHSKL